ncbi:hypothetical protein GOHSU_02_00680 [Gordonia hirsuta DSM 44140 = NBRC 16056]|uniref:Lipoprotein n=1 Tax=Gordonia hirsuta DSM 44140 = NBRC 16056 TaxID=1121927 RepID=L7L453_9ACTN|nr:hypothetical protein [Gordonia hirsuta]GAC55925.1 hypothetical protein GOHSU_02_00680 [Gordonia hirsuta DSM 44140 = NBRC 16056]
MRRTTILSVTGFALTAAALLSGCSSPDPGGRTATGTAPSVVTEVTTVFASPGPPSSAAAGTIAPAPSSVNGVIVPGESDPFVTALRRAAGTGAPLTVGIEVARSQAQVAATGDTDVVVFRTPDGLAVYVIKISDHFHQDCAAAPQLGLPDFRMCQTVRVQRDPGLARTQLPNADMPSVGDDAFTLTTVP